MDRRRFLMYMAGSSIVLMGGSLLWLYTLNRNLEINLSYDIIARDLIVPWSIQPVGERKYLVTERIGRLTYINKDRVKSLKVFNVASKGEAGLLGLAIDPDYYLNKNIYVYMSYHRNGGIINKVIRFKFREDISHLDNGITILDNIPGAPIHNGGRIRFGPDKLLYITTGDAGKPELAQDVNSLAGKILRINYDGSIPGDNPFDNQVYSYGHRNPQGLDWHPNTGILVSSEHGPIGHDEINIIVKGGNYGWPYVAGYDKSSKYINPIYETGDETIAPSGASFIKGELFKELYGSFAVGCLRGRKIFIVRFDEEMKINGFLTLFPETFGRIRDIIIDLDGSLLISTSNRDGRGIPKTGDDKVIRIYPEE